jgi:signal transduction histidine kinase
MAGTGTKYEVRSTRRQPSPTPGLVIGLVLTLAAVAAYSVYLSRQVAGLEVLQRDLVDRTRRDSLALLRIQNNLNQLGLAMRDMLEGHQPYPLSAWRAQFERIRTDLDDALARSNDEEPAGAEREHLVFLLSDLWDAADRTFALSEAGAEAEARAQVELSLTARQASASTAVARLLFENNAEEAQAAAQVQAIYATVQREVWWFLGALLVVIAATGSYAIRANRRVFAELADLSDRRRELAQQLIATRESTLRHLARELHDDLGQVLTAIGAMVGRTVRQLPEDSAARADLREVVEVAQGALTNVRTLAQTLHPSILEELGLDSTIAWYVETAGRQLGLQIDYERSGHVDSIESGVAIHVYRVLQEALSNVARHAGTRDVQVRLRHDGETITLEVEDHGMGFRAGGPGRPGLGVVTMRERAELVGGHLEIAVPPEGGTLVRLSVRP